eukprot:2429087-Rhodomonas_salina.1
MSVLREAQGACKVDMISGVLSLSALLHGCHPEFLADACARLDTFGTCYSLTMGQLGRRRRKHVGLAHTRSTVFHFSLLSNPPIDICGKIALAAREAESDPIDVEFQLLCNAIFANSVLAAEAVKQGSMAIAKSCAALFSHRKGKSTDIKWIASLQPPVVSSPMVCPRRHRAARFCKHKQPDERGWSVPSRF